jgi:hypothetical protein
MFFWLVEDGRGVGACALSAEAFLLSTETPVKKPIVSVCELNQPMGMQQ